MGNLGGGEILVILVVALLVLGPTRLPTAARQVGNAVGELKRISSGFQKEMKAAMDDVSLEPGATAPDESSPADAQSAESARRDRSRRLVTGSATPPDAAGATDAADIAEDQDLGARNGFVADEDGASNDDSR